MNKIELVVEVYFDDESWEENKTLNERALSRSIKEATKIVTGSSEENTEVYITEPGRIRFDPLVFTVLGFITFLVILILGAGFGWW